MKAQLDARGPTDLAPQIAPEEVFSSLAAPANSTTYFLPLLSEHAQVPGVSTTCSMVSPEGELRRTRINAVITITYRARRGLRVEGDGAGKTIPLTGRAFDFVWWSRVPYLASAASPLTVRLGDTEVVTSTRAGLHDLYLRVEDTFDEITFEGLDDDVTLCFDTVEVGAPEPGDPL